jgi:large subunit ribosomal protein L3
MRIGLLGKKIGMTRVYDNNGRATAVTVIEAGGNTKLQVKTPENDGYSAVQVGFDVQKESRVNKAELGHFKKAGSEPKKLVAEFRLEDGQTVGDDLNLQVNLFKPGQLVDVIGQSKGKGFQGVMKKHNMDGQGASHGSMMHRRNGAIGNRSTPGRVWKNMGMPGHMGDERVTVQNLKVLQVREADNILLITGAVPGANGSYVVVRPAIKHPVGAIAKEKHGMASVATQGAKTASKGKK